MKIDQYKIEAARTCPSLGDQGYSYEELAMKLDLAHMGLGLGSEVSELFAAIEMEDVVNIREECADIMWYLTNLHRLVCGDKTIEYYTMYTESRTGQAAIVLTHELSKLQDMIKKVVAYNKPINKEALHYQIRACILEIEAVLVFHARENTIYEDLDKNIAKLKARYPEKFTTEKALNRDLDSERQILEA